MEEGVVMQLYLVVSKASQDYANAHDLVAVLAEDGVVPPGEVLESVLAENEEKALREFIQKARARRSVISECSACS